MGACDRRGATRHYLSIGVGPLFTDTGGGCATPNSYGVRRCDLRRYISEAPRLGLSHGPGGQIRRRGASSLPATFAALDKRNGRRRLPDTRGPLARCAPISRNGWISRRSHDGRRIAARETVGPLVGRVASHATEPAAMRIYCARP